MTTPATADDYAATQRDEYGQFVALDRILIDGVLAFRKGDPVPAGHVKRGVVRDKDDKDSGLPAQVARVNTKAAQAVTGQEA